MTGQTQHSEVPSRPWEISVPYLRVQQQCLLVLEGVLGGNTSRRGECVVAR